MENDYKTGEFSMGYHSNVKNTELTNMHYTPIQDYFKKALPPDVKEPVKKPKENPKNSLVSVL